MRFIIKWRFLLKLGVSVLVAGIIVYIAHGRQVRKQVGVFLHQANISRDAAASEEELGNLKEAANEREREKIYLERYLIVRQDDLDIRERLGRLMCKTAKSGRQLLEAFLVLEDILRRDPSRHDLRRFVIDFALDPHIQLYKEGLEHAEILLQERPGDGELEGLLARCLVQIADRQLVLVVGQTQNEDSQYDRAAKMYESSIKHRPDLLSSYAGLAMVRRLHLKKTKEADDAIAEMVKKNDSNFRTYLVAAGYWREYGKPAQVDSAIDKAIQLAPDELDVLLAAADKARTLSRKLARLDRNWRASATALLTASRYLNRAQNQHPKAPAAYLALASLEADTRQFSDALVVIRKGLDALPNSAELMLGQMEYQFRNHDAIGASETLEKLRSLGLPSDVVDYEFARVSILQEKWLEAARELERSIPKLQDNPRLLREANLFLGRCYEQLGENDLRLIAFTRALPIEVTDRLWILAMVGIAEAQAALGQNVEALKTYRKVKDWATGAWINVARLEMIIALQAPDGKSDWTATEEALSMAEKAVADHSISNSTDVEILRARLMHYRGNPAEARKRLEELRVLRPKESAVWVELALQDARENKPQEGLLTLTAGEKEVGDSPDFRRVRAELLVQTKAPDLPAKIVGLASGIAKFSLPEQRQLLHRLALIASAAGADAAAGQLWEDLANAKPFDLNVHMVRFDRAVRAGNVEAMEQILKKITEIDGVNGQSARLVRAILLIQRAKATNDRAPRDAALALLDGLERERVGPHYAGRVALSQGLIHDLNGNTDRALEKYRQAIALGELNPQALRRVMELLSAKKQFSEAMDIFQKLPTATASGEEVQRLAAEVSLQTNKWKEAIEFANKAVLENSKNYLDQIWLGRVYWSAGDRVKPEAMFRKATNLAPDALDSWLILMRYLVTTGRKDEAAKVLEDARNKVKATEREIFLAFAYAQIDQPDKAVDAFKQARTQNPHDVRTLMAEAEYLLQRGQLANAREAYQRVIALPSASAFDKAYARQRLALAVAADPDYETSQTAITLLGGDDDASTVDETQAQRRSRAVILALQKDRTKKLKAIRLLQENPEGRTPNEQFLLAQLHNTVGNRPQVRVVMSELLKSKKNQIPLYVSFFALWLIRQNEIREAEEWVAEMIKSDPDSLPTAELKARLAVAKKDLAGASAALLPKAKAPGAPIGLIARICEELGLYDDTEQLLQTLVKQNEGTEPRVVLALAGYYGRRARTADALRICEEARAKLAASAVGEVAVGVLYNAKPATAGDMSKVAGWLEDARGKSQGKEQAMLLQQLATVRNLQRDYASSVTLYQQAIAANPRDVLAMNNLAYLLSVFEKRHDDALKLIEQAKKIIGSNSSLLDTEAMVHLNKGELETARKLLEIVVAEAPSASAYYRFARVELAAKHDLEAKRYWRRALELGFHGSDLHPLDLPEYERIAAQFK